MLGAVKNTLNFRREQNGLFLKVHHTMREESGEKRKIRFHRVDVTRSNEAFAALDEDDNVFVFHLVDKCFWQLSESRIRSCTAIKFVPQQSNNLLIGNKSGFIYEIEINSGRTIRCIKAFSSAVNQLELSLADPRTFVASSTNQIKIYDLESFVRKFEFATKDDARITGVKMIPNDDRMFVVLHTDVICILSNALRLIRHFEPLKLRRKYMLKANQQMEKLNYICEPADDDADASVDKLIKSVTRDHLNGIVVDVSFTQNGNSFCVSFLDNSMMFCSTSMWHVKRVIKFPDFYIKQCDFITTSHDHYNPDMLLTSTSNDDLMLMSLKDLNSRMLIDMNNSSSFTLSTNGRVLYNVLQTGEILVCNLEQCLHSAAASANNGDVTKNARNTTNIDIKCTKPSGEPSAELDKIQMKLNKAMPISRMVPILQEFGEYPEKYRAMIWKTMLKLPSNFEPFAQLAKRERHSCVASFEQRFSLVDQKAMGHLRKIISCLAHWTVVFGYVSYLPKFVFPFLKMCRGDLLLCFELVATLLSNQCQLWFEFAPSNIPYNYLCLVENVLMEGDRKLYRFYKSKNVTAKSYALPLMESAFSEVLDERQWLQLWDHVVSNEPFFMVFLIVAYNIELRATVMRYESVESIERVFVEQNYVNMKKLIAKAHSLMDKCPVGDHPKRYMKPFVPLARGAYQKFENYPKNVSDMKVNAIDGLREEQKALDSKLAEMESLEKTIKSRMEGALMDEEYERRMKEVQATYEKALEQEEERITYQRKMLLLSVKKIRERENEMLIQARNSLQSKRVAASENELDAMLRSMEKQRSREEIELQMAEESLKLKEMSLQMRDFDNINITKHEPLQEQFKKSIFEIASQKQRFMDQLRQLEHSTANCASEAGKADVVVEVKKERNVGRLQPEVDALEKAFEKIHNDYIHSADAEKHEKDYIGRAKKLKEYETLEREVCRLVENLLR